MMSRSSCSCASVRHSGREQRRPSALAGCGSSEPNEAGVTGEIDEDGLQAKRELLSSRVAARSMRCLQRYAGVSFASTAAEYIHCMWHDVTVRSGLEHLPAEWLRERLEFMVRCFPPDRGRCVIAQERSPVF
jgi:hypothetical protein